MKRCGAGVLYSAQPPALQSHLHHSLALQRRRILSRRSTAARLSVIITRLANSKIVLAIPADHPHEARLDRADDK